jgi:hypothetical protein
MFRREAAFAPAFERAWCAALLGAGFCAVFMFATLLISGVLTNIRQLVVNNMTIVANEKVAG